MNQTPQSPSWFARLCRWLAVRLLRTRGVTAEGTSYQPLQFDGSGNLLVAVAVAMPAGENHIGSIGGNSTQLSQNPTISTSAYVAGYCVGGVQTLSNALRTGGPSTGVLQSILLVDTSNQKAAMDLIFFNANPAGSTLNDHAAATIAAADAGKVIRKVSIAAADWVTDGGVAIVDKTGIGGVVSVASGTTLYMAAITSGTPTYAATALYFREGFLQD